MRYGENGNGVQPPQVCESNPLGASAVTYTIVMSHLSIPKRSGLVQALCTSAVRINFQYLLKGKR